MKKHSDNVLPNCRLPYSIHERDEVKKSSDSDEYFKESIGKMTPPMNRSPKKNEKKILFEKDYKKVN